MNNIPISEHMTAQEKRATMGLASIYGLRMFGMFSILPIFAVYAAGLPDQPSSLMIGIALGAYGLTQALFQIPYGIASDKFGRKPLIYIGLLIFAIGSVIAAMSTHIEGVIFGRVIQGAGAISAVITALVADLTRDEHRTKAMAGIGATIGVAFAVSLVGGPVLNQWIGVPGIFMLTAILSALAMLVVKFWVPDPVKSHFHSDASATPKKLANVLKNKHLLRLDFGIFALHAAQMAMFVVVPLAILQASDLSINEHWQLYLPILLGSFILMVPAIIIGEKKGKLKQVFVGAILLMFIAQLAFASTHTALMGIVVSLSAYFVAFNILEASLPSIISKIAPASAKGTAIGVYNTCQSLGVFVGGTVGGLLAEHYGFASVFAFCSILILIWLILAVTMQAPPAVKTKLYGLDQTVALTQEKTQQLRSALLMLEGAREVEFLLQEHTVMIKVDQKATWDEAQVYSILRD